MRDQFLRAIKDEPMKPANHYAYADWLEDNGFDDEARIQREWSVEKQLAAEAFVGDYAKQCQLSMRELLWEADTHIDDESHYFLCEGFDDPKSSYEEMRVFWRHFEVLTGRPVPAGRDNESFTDCSC